MRLKTLETVTWVTALTAVIAMLFVALGCGTPDMLTPNRLGIRVAPESSATEYDRAAYKYPASIENEIVDAQGGLFSPYSARCFESIRETDIEHVVAAKEAHDSGLWSAPDSIKVAFATDLGNLTVAAPHLNRQLKSAKDPAEWLPDHNRCWYVGVWITIKARYGLTMDQAEWDAIAPIYWECTPNFKMVIPDCNTGT